MVIWIRDWISSKMKGEKIDLEKNCLAQIYLNSIRNGAIGGRGSAAEGEYCNLKSIYNQ